MSVFPKGLIDGHFLDFFIVVKSLRDSGNRPDWFH